MLDRRKHTFVETIANILHHGPTYKIYKEDMHILLFLFVSFRKWPGEWLKMQNVAAKIPCKTYGKLYGISNTVIFHYRRREHNKCEFGALMQENYASWCTSTQMLLKQIIFGALMEENNSGLA